ncbi:MAG: hypothetical protein H7Z74_01265 [Anaerolineae bacterium]|nr:hypothetical protein [Gemmatimonadaceae bacterium]
MRRAYFVLSVGIIALGVVHIASTPRFFSELTSPAIWFASGGLTMILTGALNLLRQTYGQGARGLRVICTAANAVLTAFALLAAYVSGASALEVVVVLGLVGGAFVLSLLPSAQRNSTPGT